MIVRPETVYSSVSALLESSSSDVVSSLSVSSVVVLSEDGLLPSSAGPLSPGHAIAAAHTASAASSSTLAIIVVLFMRLSS